MTRPTLTQQKGLRTYVEIQRSARRDFRAQAREPMRTVQPVPPAPLPQPRETLAGDLRFLAVGFLVIAGMAAFGAWAAPVVARGLAMLWAVQP